MDLTEQFIKVLNGQFSFMPEKRGKKGRKKEDFLY